jgi:hypothetical protein
MDDRTRSRAHSGEAEHHSGLIPNSIPGRSRTTFGA